MKKLVLALFGALFLLTSCDGRRFYFYSPDGKQSFTVVKKGDYRYIYNGDSWIFPDTNYIKIDVSDVESYKDFLTGCWKDKGGWEIYLPDSDIIDSMLDTTKFSFNSRYPKYPNGEDNLTKFNENKCFRFDFLTEKLSPNKGALVK